MNCALDFFSAFLLGLASSLHCVGMCGGIVAVFANAMPNSKNNLFQRLILNFFFSSGRVITYTTFGAVAGIFSFFVLNSFLPHWAPYLRVATGGIVVLFGIHLSGVFLPLNRLESVGKPIWSFLSPKLKTFLPIDNWIKAIAAGLVWGFLPCGMVYSTLLIALTANSYIDASLIMLGFGVGTMPLLVASGVAIHTMQKILRKAAIKWLVAFSIIAFGIWIIASSGMVGSGHSMFH